MEVKGRGKRELWGEAQMRWGFFVKFPLLSKIQILSHKLLVRQISTHHHCDWHVQKPKCRDFQVILSSSSWSIITLCIFKEQIWLPNIKYHEKNSILTRMKCSKGFDTLCIWVFGCANSNGTGFEAEHSDVSQLWIICMHYLGNYSS